MVETCKYCGLCNEKMHQNFKDCYEKYRYKKEFCDNWKILEVFEKELREELPADEW